jgi:hypothetical protein
MGINGSQGWYVLFLLKMNLDFLLRKIGAMLKFKADLMSKHFSPGGNEEIKASPQTPNRTNMILISNFIIDKKILISTKQMPKSPESSWDITSTQESRNKSIICRDVPETRLLAIYFACCVTDHSTRIETAVAKYGGFGLFQTLKRMLPEVIFALLSLDSIIIFFVTR